MGLLREQQQEEEDEDQHAMTADPIDALQELVARDVFPGQTTLAELGRLLDAPAWLRNEDVTMIGALAGKLPVSWAPGATAVVTVCGGRAALYLVLDRPLDAPRVAAGLRGDPEAGAAVIREAALTRSG
jgi:hypothetical protein